MLLHPTLLAALLPLAGPGAEAAPAEALALWPGAAPGDTGDLGEERNQTPESDVIRLANVSRPTLTFYPAPADRATGATVIVCPGGGYNILAWNLEGTEICAWLNDLGVTAALLKYRVPGRGEKRYSASLQDAQRAVGLVRLKAAAQGLDPRRIGLLGFSAGGHLAAAASTNYATRTYPRVDEADDLSCRPDFTILIYPAYIAPKDNPTQLAPEIRVTPETPPAFLVQTLDDRNHVDASLGYTLALKAAGVSVEYHLFPRGGHGYGLRPSPHAVSQWPALAGQWLRQSGWLQPAP